MVTELGEEQGRDICTLETDDFSPKSWVETDDFSLKSSVENTAVSHASPYQEVDASSREPWSAYLKRLKILNWKVEGSEAETKSLARSQEISPNESEDDLLQRTKASVSFSSPL